MTKISYFPASTVFAVALAYNDAEFGAMKDAVRAMAGRRFDGDAKAWLVPARRDNAGLLSAFIERFEPEVDPAAAEALAALAGADAAEAPPPPPPPRVRVRVEGDQVILTWPYEHPQREALAAAVREMPGRRWDRESKVWRAPVSTENAAATLTLVEAFDAAIDADAVATLRGRIVAAAAAREMSHAASAEVDLPCPEGLAYLPYQRAGILYASARPCTLLADEMGLGKTIQAVGVANADAAVRRVLIICPASLRLNWQREWEKWDTKGLSVGIADSQGLPESDVVIVNYDITWKLAAALRGREWDMLIMDEGHYLKNPKAQRTVAVLGGKHGKTAHDPITARRRLALTGTPLVNRPAEGWTLFRALAPAEFPDWRQYMRRYADAHKTRFGWDVSGAANLGELQDKLRGAIMIRRRKADVLAELPPKRRQVIELPANGAARIIAGERKAWLTQEEKVARAAAAVELAKASGSYADYIAAVERLAAARRVAFTEMSKLRHETALAKVPAVIEHVTGALDGGEGKILLFAHHQDVIAQLVEGLGAYGVVQVTGETPLTARQAAVDRFQQDPGTRVFVGNIQAAGVGLTLTAASHVVFAELDWVPGNMSQAEDRCILEGEPILTETGWRPIEQIRVGDKVIGEDGNLHKVIDVWNRLAKGVDPAASKLITELYVRGWLQPIRVTSDHLMLTPEGWKPAAELMPRDQLSMPNLTDGSQQEVTVDDDCRLPERFTTMEMPLFGEYYADLRIKPKTEQRNGRLIKLPDKLALTEDAMFFFGYYLGDGFSSTGEEKGRFVSLSGNKGRKITSLKACENWLKTLGISASTYESSNDRGVEMRAFSGEFALWVSKHFGATLNNKAVPQWVFNTPPHLRRALLDGWLKSDGYVRNNRYEIITVSYRLAADAARLMMSIGKKPCITRAEKAGTFVVAYSNRVPPTLVINKVIHRQPKRNERVYDLTVEDTPSFVVGTAVVHNCHRIGQRDHVLVQHLVLEGSIDAHLARVLVEKQQILDAAMDAPTGMVHAPAPEIAPDADVLEPDAPGEVTLADEDRARLSAGRREGWIDRRAATSGIGRARIEKEAATITPAQIAAVHEALRWLAAMDRDRAAERNQLGYNQADTFIGHALSNRDDLTPKEAVLGRHLVKKYHRQLGAPALAAMGLRADKAGS